MNFNEIFNNKFNTGIAKKPRFKKQGLSNNFNSFDAGADAVDFRHNNNFRPKHALHIIRGQKGKFGLPFGAIQSFLPSFERHLIGWDCFGLANCAKLAEPNNNVVFVEIKKLVTTKNLRRSNLGNQSDLLPCFGARVLHLDSFHFSADCELPQLANFGEMRDKHEYSVVFNKFGIFGVLFRNYNFVEQELQNYCEQHL